MTVILYHTSTKLQLGTYHKTARHFETN